MISSNQKKYLRSLSHHRPVAIWIGQKGLTENVSREIDLALDHHELVKIRMRVGDQESQDDLLDRICNEHHADLIERKGNTASIFRINPDSPQIRLPA